MWNVFEMRILCVAGKDCPQPLARSSENYRPGDHVRKPCRKDDAGCPSQLTQARDLRQATQQEMYPCAEARLHQIRPVAVMLGKLGGVHELNVRKLCTRSVQQVSHFFKGAPCRPLSFNEVQAMNFEQSRTTDASIAL